MFQVPHKLHLENKIQYKHSTFMYFKLRLASSHFHTHLLILWLITGLSGKIPPFYEPKYHSLLHSKVCG